MRRPLVGPLDPPVDASLLAWWRDLHCLWDGCRVCRRREAGMRFDMTLEEGVVVRLDFTAREWERAMERARLRYRNEIRRYRGIDRIRRQYRRKKGRKW